MMKLSRRHFLASAGAFVGAAAALPVVRYVMPASAPTFVNVLDYGADPTGLADSTAAVRSAIAALSREGGTVVFPAGNYYVPDLSVMGINIVLQQGDDGACTTLRG